MGEPYQMQGGKENFIQEFSFRNDGIKILEV
jgi:hypothetical protein